MPRPSVPVPLDESLQRLVLSKGLHYEYTQQPEKPSQIVIVFTHPDRAYWSITAEVDRDPNWTPDQFKDALYDAAAMELDKWIAVHQEIGPCQIIHDGTNGERCGEPAKSGWFKSCSGVERMRVCSNCENITRGILARVDPTEVNA